MSVHIRLLPSGYIHARLSSEIFFQWPRGEEPRLSDGFPRGVVNDMHLTKVRFAYEHWLMRREGME